MTDNLEKKIVGSCDNLLKNELIDREQYNKCEDIFSKYSLDLDFEFELQKYTGNKSEKMKRHYYTYLNKIRTRFTNLINQYRHYKKLDIQNRDDERNSKEGEKIRVKIQELILDVRNNINFFDNLSKDVTKGQYHKLISNYKIIESNRDLIKSNDIKRKESIKKYEIIDNKLKNLHFNNFKFIYLIIFLIILIIISGLLLKSITSSKEIPKEIS